MTKRDTDKIYRRRRGSPALLALIVLLVLTAASALIALAWQGIQGTDPPQNLVVRLEDRSSSQEESSSSEQPPSSQESPSEPEEPQGLMGAVPESPRVRSDYFDDAMFVGDSITTGIELYEVMSNATVVAATGINLDNIMTKNVIELEGQELTIPEAMTHYHPKKIYIMLGANGVGGLTAEQTASYYANFVDLVKSQHPGAIIYVQSILPINEAKFAQKYNGAMTNAKIDETNAAILQMAQEKQVYYLNVAEAFKDETGGLPASATPDGLHFGTESYTKWFDYLKTHTVTEE